MNPATPVAVRNLHIDPAHSSLEFSVRYLQAAKIRGRLNSFSGSLTGATSAEDFSAARLVFEAPVSSLDSNQAMRDQHLRSAQWFDADQFPTIRFESSAIAATEPGTYQIEGLLTLKGKTLPLTLHARFRGTGRGAQGEGRAGFSFQATLNRRDFGVVAGAQDVGGFFLSDKVKLTGEISLIDADEPANPENGR